MNDGDEGKRDEAFLERVSSWIESSSRLHTSCGVPPSGARNVSGGLVARAASRQWDANYVLSRGFLSVLTLDSACGRVQDEEGRT